MRQEELVGVLGDLMSGSLMHKLTPDKSPNFWHFHFLLYKREILTPVQRSPEGGSGDKIRNMSEATLQT